MPEGKQNFSEDPLAKQAPKWNTKLLLMFFHPLNGNGKEIVWGREKVKESYFRISLQPKVLTTVILK